VGLRRRGAGLGEVGEHGVGGVAVAGECVVVIFGDPLGQEVKDVSKLDGRAGIEGDGGLS
jgi:hypothetical protein